MRRIEPAASYQFQVQNQLNPWANYNPFGVWARLLFTPQRILAPTSTSYEFLLYDVVMPWDAGKSFCKAQNAELASFSSEQELSMVMTLVRNWATQRFNTTVQLWFGAQRAAGAVRVCGLPKCRLAAPRPRQLLGSPAHGHAGPLPH